MQVIFYDSETGEVDARISLEQIEVPEYGESFFNPVIDTAPEKLENWTAFLNDLTVWDPKDDETTLSFDDGDTFLEAMYENFSAVRGLNSPVELVR